VKSIFGAMDVGRKSREVEESYQLREPAVPYSDHFVGKKGDRGPENIYFWSINP